MDSKLFVFGLTTISAGALIILATVVFVLTTNEDEHFDHCSAATEVEFNVYLSVKCGSPGPMTDIKEKCV